jgi:GT2 family glycosyltransferase/glycosyltransferase involved in cell wall biosynthesis
MNGNAIHLLVLSDSLSAPPLGGNAIRMMNPLIGLCATGRYEVTILFQDWSQDEIRRKKTFFSIYPRIKLVGICNQNRSKIKESDATLEIPGEVFNSMDLAYYNELRELVLSLNFDLVIVEHSWMSWTVPLVKTIAPGLPVILDLHNIEATILERWISCLPENERQDMNVHWQKMFRWEQETWQWFDACQAVSALEKRKFEERTGQKILTWDLPVSGGIDLDRFPWPPARDRSEKGVVLHLATVAWPPNNHGLLWFINEVMPLLKKTHPFVRLYIAGTGRPYNTLLESIKDRDDIVFLGEQSEEKPLFDRSDVLIIPLFVGAGARIRIPTAWAGGIPVVSTTLGAEGMNYSDGKDILIADTPADFANKVASVIDNQELAMDISDNGRRLAEKHHSQGYSVQVYDGAYKEILQKAGPSSQKQEISQQFLEREKSIRLMLQVKSDLQSELNDLKSIIEQQRGPLQSGIVMHFLGKYQRVTEKLWPQGSRRGRLYELGLAGIRVILNEGWRSFFSKVKNRVNKKKPENKLNKPALSSAVLKLAVRNISFPEPSGKPEVSIVIPVYNKWQFTINCLKSVSENTLGNYEVIVVNDASIDETVELLAGVKNLFLINNSVNSGFVDSCNLGAKFCKGDYILFLNNDTEVTENWLPPLIETIKQNDVGAVGCKLVSPDHTLLEAGAIIWKDGSAWCYGRGHDPEKPEFNYVKEVDYCAGACLLVKKELFERTGGFDVRFKPAYYEETDLCFSIRSLGYRVIYQPRSVVTHFEGITYGKDISSGTNKNQEVNKAKFVEKWGSILEKQYEFSAGNVILARNKHQGKRILLIEDGSPSRGVGYPRAFSLVKMIAELGCQITFYLYETSFQREFRNGQLQQMGVEFFSGNNPNFSEFVLSRPHYFDAVVTGSPRVWKIIDQTYSKYFGGAPLLCAAQPMYPRQETLKDGAKRPTLTQEDAEFFGKLQAVLQKINQDPDSSPSPTKPA